MAVSAKRIEKVIAAAVDAGLILPTWFRQSGMPGYRWTVTFVDRDGMTRERSYTSAEMDCVADALHYTHGLMPHKFGDGTDA